MSTRKQILTQGSRQREPKSPQIYRRGRVNNSVAYYRGAKPDATAGGVNATAAKFLSDIAKPLGQIAGKRQQEFQEAERNAGIASFTRATPEQRAKMRNAIKNGIISESESPYFREGVSIAYTKNLLGKYNQDLFQRYEQWEGKNKEDSGNFDQFLDEFDAEYAPYFETVHQDILTEHFIPGQMGIRRQLQQRHTEHLNKNYRDQADSQYSGAFHQMMQDYLGDAYAEQLKSNETLRNMVSNQEADHINTLTTEEGLMGALKDGNISKKHRDLLSQGKYGQAILKEYDERFGEDYSSGSGKYNTKARYKIIGSEVDTSLLKEGEKIVYKEEDYSTLGEGMVSLPFIKTTDGNIITRAELNKRKEKNKKGNLLETFDLTKPITSLESFGKKTGVSKDKLMSVLRGIKKPSFAGDTKPDMTYIHPKNWTVAQKNMILKQLSK